MSAVLPALAQSAGGPERWSALADTVFRTYGADNGMPAAAVMTYAEDGDGFLWVGTQSGLARWDGYHFRLYRRDPAGPGALPDDFIWCLQTDDQGRLWVGTNNGGLARYDKTTDRFVTIPVGPPGLGTVPVRSLAGDGAGGMWVGSNRGLDHLGPDGQELGRWHHDNADPSSLPVDEVRTLLRDRSGALWVGTNSGLVRLDQGASNFTFVPLPEAGAPLIRALVEAEDGRIWVATDTNGAYVIASAEQPAKPVPGTEHQSILTMVEAAPGEMWFGLAGEGLLALNPATGGIRHIRHDPTRATSLPHDLLFSLHRDRSGLVWVGTYAGVGVTDPSQNAILTAFGGSNQANRLTGADTMVVLAAHDGETWISYLAGGIDILDPQGQRVTTLRSDPAHPQASLVPERIRAMAQSDKGDVYLGSYRGLYRVGSDGVGIVHLPLGPNRIDPVILSLTSDVAGLWIGTRGEGLWRFDYTEGKARQLGSGSLADKWISAIAPAGNGKLWLGSFQGLSLFDPVTGESEQTLPDPKTAQPRGGELVSSLLTDRRGRLWVGMVGGGLAVIDGQEPGGLPHFRRIGPADGLPGANIDTLLEDKSGVIWGSGGNGAIVRVDPDNLALRIFRRAEGVGVTGFAMSGGARTAEGDLLFAGDGGLTIVRPERFKPWTYRPPVVVTDLRIGGRQIPPQSMGKTGLEIAPDANSLSVEFAALDYSAPDRNLYAYRLEGYDQDWVESDSMRRLASYTNLPPRRYTLHLRASNRDGVWNETTLDIPIMVLPAWHQTVWFHAVLLGLVALGIWLLVRGRTRYLRHRQRVLEQQVAERTAELLQSNEQLQMRTIELGDSLLQVAASRGKVAALLDASGQGFLSFGPNLVVDPDCSRACATMLDCEPVGRKIDVVLFADEPNKAEVFRHTLSSALLSEDPQRCILLLSLLPSFIQRRGRRLKAEYPLLDNGHVMVVLTDITEEHRLAGRVESEHRRLEMIVAAVTDSRDFFDAVDSYRQFFRADLMQTLASQAPPLSIHQQIYRQIHTFKGTFAQLSFDATPRMLHKIEDGLAELTDHGESMTIGQIVELVVPADFHGMLENDLIVLRNALGDEMVDQGKGVFLPMSQAKQLRAIADRLSAGEKLDVGTEEIRALFAEFRNLDKIALADALSVYDRVVSQVAKRLGKETARLSIDGGEDLWLDPERYGPFLRSLVHLFRNAVVHGIETPSVRRARGKVPAGRIYGLIRRHGDVFTLTVADDGTGIDVPALRRRAVALELIPPEQIVALTDEEVIALIFTGALAGPDRADDLAGRGVGMAALHAETSALGGDVRVSSTAGKGTRFEFSFPCPGESAVIDMSSAGSA